MFETTVEKIVYRIIWIGIYAGMMLCMFRMVYKNVIYEKMGIHIEIVDRILADDEIVSEEKHAQQVVSIDWSKQYPGKTREVSENKGTSIVDKYENGIKNIKDKIIWYYEKGFPFYMDVIEIATDYENILGWNVSEVGKPFILEDGYCIQVEEQAEVDACSEKLIEFNRWLEEKEVDLLYVQAPSKINSEMELPYGFVNYSNANADELLGNLEQSNIHTLDLREKMRQRSVEWNNMFYKTDHHWKVDTALWAAGEISRELNSKYGYSVSEELFDLNNYKRTIYEDVFLGSYGRKVTMSKVKPEDYEVIVPDFSTNLHLYLPELGIDENGEFEELFIDYDRLDVNNYYTADAYATYKTRREYMTQIHNANAENKGTRILFLRDSYANPLVPFVSLQYEKVDALALQMFSGSVRAYIEETKPDVVVVMYIPTNISSEELGYFDFR